MMERIELLSITKKNNTITFAFGASDGLQRYFSGKPFRIEYSENIEAVPDAVAAVPFVCNVLPIVWLADAKLIVPELDEAFFNCIPEVKKGYETMYPESDFRGEIEVGRVISCDRSAVPGKCAMFYSGGVDSMDTLFRHVEEKPDLISIWGSDIKYDNEEGWKLVHRAIEEAAERYELADVVIHSSFREFDREGVLSKDFSEQLQRNYWYGLKHGMGLLGHVAPYAYLHKLSSFYIASSNCPDDGEIRCASDPRTDNKVRYAGCRVIHDGFECTRQDKLENIVRYNHKEKTILPLHVCWESQSGTNCCHCEKCYRTMVGLILENADPLDYGFSRAKEELPKMQVRMALGGNHAPKTWNRLHLDAVKRKRILSNNQYWKHLKWITKADFLKLDGIKLPLSWRILSKLRQCYIYSLFSKLKRNNLSKQRGEIE